MLARDKGAVRVHDGQATPLLCMAQRASKASVASATSCGELVVLVSTLTSDQGDDVVDREVVGESAVGRSAVDAAMAVALHDSLPLRLR
jgi:hypothetical protein